MASTPCVWIYQGRHCVSATQITQGAAAKQVRICFRVL